jgi:hypothetical protein
VLHTSRRDSRSQQRKPRENSLRRRQVCSSITHELLEQQKTRALGEKSGTKVHLAKVARIQYSDRRLFSVVLWYLDTASSVTIMRPTVTKGSARVLFAWRLCHSYRPPD